MNERLLQFIWQHQYFSRSELITVSNEQVQVVNPGILNTNQGPDFLNARIKIEDTLWVGHVELHLLTSGWKLHAHENDVHYQNVILHVVWEHDKHINNIPVLELNNLVSNLLFEKYKALSGPSEFIPCEEQFSSVPVLLLENWKDKLITRRLRRKSGYIKQLLHQTNVHWEEVFWWMIARNFGSRVNSDCFEFIARSIPLALLARHRNQPIQVEALLMGQAGLLDEEFHEHYPKFIQKEYRHYKQLYKLTAVNERPKFLRMRPANFPGVRLAQLAMLVCKSTHLFSSVKDAETVSSVVELLNVTAGDYWNSHYRFDEFSSLRPKSVGPETVNGIIINTICPILFCYGDYYGKPEYITKATLYLKELKAEVNTLISGFAHAGAEITNAWDSQALTELKNEFCNSRRCLDCEAGCNILKR